VPTRLGPDAASDPGNSTPIDSKSCFFKLEPVGSVLEIGKFLKVAPSPCERSPVSRGPPWHPLVAGDFTARSCALIAMLRFRILKGVARGHARVAFGLHSRRWQGKISFSLRANLP
jgi:hypothetical protein